MEVPPPYPEVLIVLLIVIQLNSYRALMATDPTSAPSTSDGESEGVALGMGLSRQTSIPQRSKRTCVLNFTKVVLCLLDGQRRGGGGGVSSWKCDISLTVWNMACTLSHEERMSVKENYPQHLSLMMRGSQWKRFWSGEGMELVKKEQLTTPESN